MSRLREAIRHRLGLDRNDRRHIRRNNDRARASRETGRPILRRPGGGKVSGKRGVQCGKSVRPSGELRPIDDGGAENISLVQVHPASVKYEVPVRVFEIVGRFQRAVGADEDAVRSEGIGAGAQEGPGDDVPASREGVGRAGNIQIVRKGGLESGGITVVLDAAAAGEPRVNAITAVSGRVIIKGSVSQDVYLATDEEEAVVADVKLAAIHHEFLDIHQPVLSAIGVLFEADFANRGPDGWINVPNRIALNGEHIAGEGGNDGTVGRAQTRAGQNFIGAAGESRRRIRGWIEIAPVGVGACGGGADVPVIARRFLNGHRYDFGSVRRINRQCRRRRAGG